MHTNENPLPELDLDAFQHLLDEQMKALQPAADAIEAKPSTQFDVPPPQPQRPSLSIPAASKSGTKHTTLRIPKHVVVAFKSRAEKTGERYQTLINRTLREAASLW